MTILDCNGKLCFPVTLLDEQLRQVPMGVFALKNFRRETRDRS